MEKKKKYWLFIYPHIFIFTNECGSLFYNTESGAYLFCEIDNEIEELCKQENMYSILINENILKKSVPIKQITEKCFGELIPYEEESVKPISIFPHCLIEKNINTNFDDASLYSYFFELTELTLMVTGECSLACAGCGITYKQHQWCHKDGSEISFDKLRQFLQFLISSRVMHINLTGGDVFSYSYIDDLLLFLNEFSITKKIIIHSELITRYIDRLSVLSDPNYMLEILVDPSFDNENLRQIIKTLRKYKVSYVIAVYSIDDYEKADSFALVNNIEPDIVPVFNGKNLSFFEDYVFMNDEDILNSHVTMKEIFAHQLINTNNYGKLIITSDGRIVTNYNKGTLGTIEDNIYKIIHSQMFKGSDWRDIRKNGVCSECLLQWLCPSLSDYNSVLGRSNLCNHK